MMGQIKRPSQSLGIFISAVTISSFAIIFLSSACNARTATVISPITPPPTQGTIGKDPARRIMDPAFVNAGKNAGLEIWRIENFKPVAYPQRDFGKFYTGDSYIVLNSKKDKNNKFSWDVHFWLGSETSQDEAGAAAILTVQLDDLLNGIPIQHRETQDHESSLFLSYFKNGVRYEQGGVGTGFRHTETNASGEKRLFQVKGKRNVRVRQVNLSVSSMNKGDCFILDAGNEIFVYVGSGAKRVEKLKATSAANQIRDQDHNGRARVHTVDEFSSDVDKQQFFTILGSGSPSEVPEETTAEEDGAFESADERATTLYKVSDVGGSLKVDTISTKPIRQEMLDTNDCFILDTGSGLFVWVGKKATAQEKSQSLVKAQDFIKSKKYPAWTHVNRIVEGAESAPFKQYFATWRDVGMSHNRLIRSTSSDETDGDDDSHKTKQQCTELLSDGEGSISKMLQYVFHPVKEEVISRDVTQYLKSNLILGFSSYIFQYDFENSFDEKYTILYVWHGTKAPKSTLIEALKSADTMKNELKKNVIIVWMEQGYEPQHFIKIFKGKLISTFTGAPVDTQLYQITGIDKDDVRVNEIEFSSDALHTEDAFAIITDSTIYIWLGLGASEDEKNVAKTRIQELWSKKRQVIVEEGLESDEFWKIMGEKNTAVQNSNGKSFKTRFFNCDVIDSEVRLNEVQEFKEKDLFNDGFSIIDNGNELYIWIGEQTSNEEDEQSFKIVMEYLEKDPLRNGNNHVTTMKIHQDFEPTCFKNVFFKY